MATGSITVKLDKDMVIVQDAQLPHFSRYALGMA